ncbi:MAG: MFS transporter [Casimicrobiaceae bacterium]
MTPSPAPGTVNVRPLPAAVQMNAGERRATASLASIYGLRLLGMFVVLPVFALYAVTLDGGASHTMIGIALGAYGLTQAILQIPFGWASDRWGRKPVIYAGLAIFAIGSFVAAAANTIEWVIVGRCLQGAGAISAAVIALTADLTRDAVRTRAMAIIGITIAVTFALSLIAGPLLKAAIGVPGIFALTGVLALGALAVVRYAVPDPAGLRVQREAGRSQLRRVLTDPQLLRLNYGTFALHAALMALFAQVPFALVDLGLTGERHWVVYLPVLLLSILFMLPFLRQVDRAGRGKPLMVGAVVALGAAQVAVATSLHSLVGMVVALTLFFTALNLLEAMLPSLVSKCAPEEARGAAIGVNASMQFLGAFVGAAAGGFLSQHAGTGAVFMLGVGLTLVWLAATATMTAPPARYRHNYSMGET